MSGDDVTIIAEDVVAGYLPGVDILTGVDLTLGTGELVGIIGPNGAGKSTLVKALFGLVGIREGIVTMRGEDITNLTAHELVARGVGYVPQRANVFETLTAEENLRMGLYLDPEAWDERLPVVLELFPHLRTRSEQRAGFMSGGERQMLAMGRALMMNPDVLLLDEPSAGLSPANQDHVFDRVRDICDSGVSIIMVEQNARRCLQICDRAYVMDQGKNAYTGPGHKLLHDPKIIDLYLGTLGRAE
ncbi:MAG: ABC transporter ATP-binding protein [bacterium]|nr:ABC transporter ATP-binding protein [bacterium]